MIWRRNSWRRQTKWAKENKIKDDSKRGKNSERDWGKIGIKREELTPTIQVSSDGGMASTGKRFKFETIASSLSKIPTPTKTEKSAQQLIAIYKEKHNGKQLKLFLFILFLGLFSNFVKLSHYKLFDLYVSNIPGCQFGLSYSVDTIITPSINYSFS